MDTACPDGWRKALGEISRVPFRALVPGHGGVMSRAGFAAWRMAYDGRSSPQERQRYCKPLKAS
jgi:hypothetical protein